MKATPTDAQGAATPLETEANGHSNPEGTEETKPVNRLADEQKEPVSPANGPSPRTDSNGRTPGVGRLRVTGDKSPHKVDKTLAIFCYEPPSSSLGQYVATTATALASRQNPVHIFSRHPFALAAPGIQDHAVGESTEGGLLEQVQEYTQRAVNAFRHAFPTEVTQVALMGHEWSSVPALLAVQQERTQDAIFALHSLERQRSDLSSDLSKRIEEIEQSGLREAEHIWIQQPAVGEIAKYWVPESVPRQVLARQAFPIQQFRGVTDPGMVKARYQVGPTNPTILYTGDFDDRHGPDVLMKSVPAILKNHPQARFILAGDGAQWWPLRVHTRYLLLENVVRMPGSIEGQAMFELIQAADVIVVPSREQTEWWPILAAWAARRPVVTTHMMVGKLRLEHEHNCILTYPHESSCVWGIERLLFNPDLSETIGEHGFAMLEERFGWNCVAEQIEELMGIRMTNF